MADKEGKKRKRQSNGVGQDQPNKRAAISVHHHSLNGLHPVFVSSPGLIAPSIPYKPYSKSLSNRHSDAAPKPGTHDLLLHSSAHPRLDYTAAPISLDEHLSHYVAVFDPASNSLQITPAHHLSLRSTLRSDKAESSAAHRSYAQQREQLGQEFGTKKAKKAIASKTDNAITKGGTDTGKKNDVQAAILDSMADTTAQAPKKEDLEQAMLAAKPIPKPNLQAEKVEDVYIFSTLVPPHEARLVPVRDWQEKTKADEEIKFTYRYPAFRVSAVGKSDDILKLKALAYLSLLLEFNDALQTTPRAGKKVPKKEIMSTKLAAWPEQLVDSVRRRFSTEGNDLPKWNMDNLYSHMCALTLYVDGWVTDITDLKDDLKMESKELVKYYLELGCKVGALTEREREMKKLSKSQAAQTKMAKLKLPLEFPKPRVQRVR